MEQRNIFLVIVDCLRSDYAYGTRGDALTPQLAALQREGVSFTQTVATTSVTSPNIADIFTGVYPFMHGIKGLYGYKLNPEIPTLAEILYQFGFMTHAMVSGPLAPELGLGRGFKIYEHRTKTKDFGFGLEEDLIKAFKGLRSPWFLVLHTFMLHAPRRVPDAFDRTGYGRTNYERTLSAFDHSLSRILNFIDWSNTLLLLTGDHGENLKTSLVPNLFRVLVGKIHQPSDHIQLKRFKSLMVRFIRKIRARYNMRKDGWLTQPGHGFHVYEQLIRVPLLIVCPQLIPANVKIHSLTRHVDILPTILELSDIKRLHDSPLHGHSLVPRMRGEAIEEDTEAFLMANGECLIEEANWLYGVRNSRYKYIYSPFDSNYEELYDLKEDPYERRNVAGLQPGISASLRRRIEEAFSTQVIFGMDESEKKRLEQTLRDLGYL